MLTPAQLEAHHRGIGGSDAAAALGLDRFKTTLHLYLEKTNGLAPYKRTDAMLWGELLEPVIRQRFVDVKGIEIDTPTSTFVHPRYNFMIAHLDGVSGKRLFEAKTARIDEGWGQPGTDEIPEPYMIQVQHCLAVTGLEVADVAVLIGGSDFRIYEVPADLELQQMVIENEHVFWQHVLLNKPPEPEYGDWTRPEMRGVISRLYPLTSGELRLANEDQERWYRLYQEASEIAKAHESVAEGALNHLVWEMQDAAMLQFSDARCLRRKLIKKREFTVPASQYWDHRVVKGGVREPEPKQLTEEIS